MFTRNLGTKVVSLLLAVVLWAYVSVRTSPTSEVTIWAPVRAQDLASHYSYVVVPDRVAVRVRGAREHLAALEREQGTVQVVAGAKDLGPGEHSVVVAASQLPGVRIVSIEPNPVRLRVEQLAEKRFRLVVKTQTLPPSGYTLGELKVFPSEVTVRGERSEVARIAAAGVAPDLKVLAERGTAAAQVNFYDARGEAASPALAAVEPSLVTVSAGAMRVSAKEVPVYVVPEVPAQSGWRIQSVEVRPSTVVLTGLPTVLGGIPSLRLSMTISEPKPLVSETLAVESPPGTQVVGVERIRVRVQMAPSGP